MTCRAGLLVALAAAACCSKSDVKNGAGPAADTPPPRPTFTLFAVAEMRGQIGPCGCTSDPLGDVARTAKLVADARAAGPTLVVDAGSLLYSKSPIPAHLEAQETLKAQLLVDTWATHLDARAIGLGPADLARGPAAVAPARQAVNLAPGTGIAVAPPELVEVGGTQVGVFGVLAPGAVPDLAITDPVAAGKAAVAELRARGARVIVGLVQAGAKKDAAALARDIGGIDFAIAGLGAHAPEPERVDATPQRIGDGWLVIPANRGQVVARLDVTVRGDGAFTDAVGAAAAGARTAAIDQELAAIDADLARFAADKDADPAFVRRKQAERAALAAEAARLRQHPLVVPARGPYFTLAQIRIAKGLACATPVQDAVTAFYRAAGEANARAAAGKPVPPPAKGQPGYAGGEACEDCHAEAVEFWKQTRHAAAWKTLVDRGQELDYDCISCHVTGFDRPGGSNMAINDTLRDVQCETCHGPGSIHVAKGGEEKPASVVRLPAAELCATQCHTPEHSDTFQLEAYMRDVVGPGHGAAYRATLGDGPTGGALRKAALDKAGRLLGAGCVR